MMLSTETLIYKPILFNLLNDHDCKRFAELKSLPGTKVFDTITDQLKELIKLRNPQRKIVEAEYQSQIKQLLDATTPEKYGVWVYYEWNNTLVHTLAEHEFIEVRTSRNQYKITKQERDLLSQKKIGIIGLSVGQSIALTLAIERVCGELRLADFDTLELSNLNRIRSGIHNLGVPKVIIAAREIAEIDPYLTVTLFEDGLTDENMEAFFGIGNSKLDLLVEVCDGLDIKIKSRHKARALHIPVVMDTNDRGMLDIERFDLEPERPILHGLAGDLNPENIKDLTNEQKIPYILKMVGAETISTRLKASMMEVEQTLNTWPQLASSVQLGGAATTDVCRRILLDQLKVSGRFYLDLDELIADKVSTPASPSTTDKNPFQPLDSISVRSLATHYFNENKLAEEGLIPAESELQAIIDAAIAAPSAGNNQPWKWFYEKGRLLLLHDRYRSWSWGDYAEMGALMSLGTAIESVTLKSLVFNYQTSITYVQNEQYPNIIAEITFTQTQADSHKLSLAKNLHNRHTNRKAGTGDLIPPNIIQRISSELTHQNNFSFTYLHDKATLLKLGEIIASCDRIRLLHKQGHEEFFHEIRWNHEEALKTRDGIEITSVDISESEIAGFRIAKDYEGIKYLRDWNLGGAFKKMSTKSMETASGFGIVSIQEFNKKNLLEVGQSILRAWILANNQNISFYPMLSPAFFFNRLIHGKGEGIPNEYITELTELYSQFQHHCTLEGFPIFMFRLSITQSEPVKTLRMDKHTIFVD